MENALAPSVVIPPCAISSAWNTSTIVPSRAITGGRKRIAPNPVPVGCELDPVTDGIFSADSTNANAPAAPSRSLVSGSSRTCLTTARAPCTTNGAATTVHTAACSGGRYPSAMCMTAPGVASTGSADPRTPDG